jgi:hypothetical protein
MQRGRGIADIFPGGQMISDPTSIKVVSEVSEKNHVNEDPGVADEA